MINYFKNSFKRKRARRITQEYGTTVDTFNLEKDGKVEFANWDNPLIESVKIEQSSIDFFRKFVKKGDLIIDIGANIGEVTVAMGVAAGKEGTTLAFDPNPYVYKVLSTNASLNKDKTNITPINCAISTEDKNYYYTSSEASFSNGGISEEVNLSHGKFVYPKKIKGVNLLNYLNANYKEQLDKFTFIKIDTEGYDKEILKSIKDLIIKYKPVIVAESFGKSSKEAKMELFDVIDSYGYDMNYFEDFKIEAKIAEIKKAEDMLDWENTINLYAIPKD